MSRKKTSNAEENPRRTFSMHSFFVCKKMLQGGYKIRDQSAIHFITFSVVEWVDVFTRKQYANIILDSWRYCQKEKGLLLHAWCIMSNHLHFIASSKINELSGTLRDFKKFTSSEIVKAIQSNKQESRRDWMLPIFQQAGATNSRNKSNQFWQQSNHPIELYSSSFIVQRINYIHQNPVRAGIVDRAEFYNYSSAKDYFYGKKCGLLDVEFL